MGRDLFFKIIKKFFFIFFFFTYYIFSANWTIMVYLDGDNDLEEYAIDDFLEISSVGSDQNINIVVQFDRINGNDRRYGDWTECNRFYITTGMTPTRENSIKNWGDGVGGREVNMGDPQTLINFINWAKTNYPAEKYALILWNHGNGWKSLNFLESYKRRLYKEICYDQTSYDSLSIKEVRQALFNNYFDLIGFDACLMGMIEVVTEIKDYGSVFVSSESTETIYGWNYQNFLSNLKDNPQSSPEELSFFIVNSSYQETLSSIRLNKIEELNQKLTLIVEKIMEENDYLNVFLSRTDTLVFDGEFADLYNFFENYYSHTENDQIKNLIVQFQSIFSQAIIADNNLDDKAYGLSIYFPSYDFSMDPLYNENNLIFCTQTNWDEFLNLFLNVDLLEGYIKIFSEDFSDGLPLNWTIIDGFNDGYTWMSENPKNRSSQYLYEPFMIVDSDWAGNIRMDEQLISCSFNFSYYNRILLKFSHKFFYWSDEIADLDIKIGQSDWVNLKRWQKTDEEGIVIVDITDIARGKNDVKFRWHYYNANYDWYWAIDNVEILIKSEKGDINSDGQVDISDVILCLRMVIGLDQINLETADMDEDKKVDISDVILILNKAVGLS
ncbi:MAG: clostripain-related cysteine peptidase [Candidatus Omnitrophica bacterium]|nr:clostripain-related cysteine peptidase [Candidatus Omnitrophota bacterium]MCM8802540.1 clostripain-related cysteine peptidase [Candidatus Omnitrophota bacterium]